MFLVYYPDENYDIINQERINITLKIISIFKNYPIGYSNLRD